MGKILICSNTRTLEPRDKDKSILDQFPNKHSSWWRRLEDILIKMSVFALVLHLQKTSSRRLQEVLVKANIFVLAISIHGVFKTSCKNIFKTSSRRLKDVLKTSSRRLQDVLKTSSRRLEKRLQVVFMTSSRRLAKIASRHFEDVSSS